MRLRFTDLIPVTFKYVSFLMHDGADHRLACSLVNRSEDRLLRLKEIRCGHTYQKCLIDLAAPR